MINIINKIKLKINEYYDKEIFNHVYSDLEESLLDKISYVNRVYFYREKTKGYAFDDDNNIVHIKKIIGSYRVIDIDYLHYRTVCKLYNGRIIEIRGSKFTLYDYKPHFWVIYLSNYDKELYSRDMDSLNDYELSNVYMNKLPIAIKRKLSLKKVLN